jgi:uncharacterized membrane protein
MDKKQYQTLRYAVIVFLVMLIGLAVLHEQILLILASAAAGFLFLRIMRSSSRMVVDEREQSIREQAAQITYLIFAPTLGISALLLLLLGDGKHFFLESLGLVLAYLTLFLITLYSITSYFIDRKLGGDGQEE